MFKRIVKLSKSHSFFLFGARATGKTTLLKTQFPKETTLWIDLLNPDLLDRLDSKPEELRSLVEANYNVEWTVIDEIQKVPALLDVVHSIMSQQKMKFVLTGSSARKLKRNQANLLAGRAFNYVCHPLLSEELGDQFQISDILEYGSLPEVFSLSMSDKKDFLRAYVETYFKEEIVAEQTVRKLKPFKNFLNVAAQMNAKILNLNRIATDVGVDHSTVQTYFEILEDTLVGFLLPPFHESIRKRQRQASKFYYFDIGLTRALKKNLELPLKPGTYEYGDIFEQFIILEIKRLIDYRQPDWTLSYIRSKDDAEVDLVIERPGQKRALIEIKSTSHMSISEEKEIRASLALAKDIPNSEIFVFSQDPIERKVDGVWFLPWKKGLTAIGLSR